ncbi:hypothetical protein KC19_8G175400 [Ceratodon purpureus]|uniref:Uncharacterized protein n=1 Tax=Ceratodon purpureus TaxID=3225 RepID=A0A8T0GZH8_CERPU|nr:hypothetical protein KC19_8G175400 [Ceratodon purpureus]
MRTRSDALRNAVLAIIHDLDQMTKSSPAHRALTTPSNNDPHRALGCTQSGTSFKPFENKTDTPLHCKPSRCTHRQLGTSGLATERSVTPPENQHTHNHRHLVPPYIRLSHIYKQ